MEKLNYTVKPLQRFAILIALFLSIITFYEFAIPKKAEAAVTGKKYIQESTVDEVGADKVDINKENNSLYGVLFTPVQDLCLGIGDVIMDLIAKTLMSKNVGWPVLYLSKTKWYVKAAGFILAGLAAVLLAIFTTLTAGAILLIAGAIVVCWYTGSALISMARIGGTGKTLSSDTQQETKDAAQQAWVELMPDQIDIPNFTVTIEDILTNNVPMTDVNFMHPRTIYTIDKAGSQVEISSSANILQSTVAGWYGTLRYIAIVLLLLVLVYMGIRFIIGSTNAEKAKYKEHLIDWIVALAIIFFLHYFMSFATTLTEIFTAAISTDKTGIIIYNIPINHPDYSSGTSEDDLEDVKEISEASKQILDKAAPGWSGVKDYDSGAGVIITDLTGYIRWNCRIGTVTKNGMGTRFGYTMMYLVIVFYTIYFAVTYVKRVVMLAFLTMIAPLVAVTYPLDKIRDGQAQGFNFWIKEYMYNLMIQPIHLILYQLIIGSSIALVKHYPLFGLVAIGFLIPAENLVRQMFGFSKSQTQGDLAKNGMAALGVMSAARGIAGGLTKGVTGLIGGGAGAVSKAAKSSNNIRFQNNGNDMNALGEGDGTGLGGMLNAGSDGTPDGSGGMLPFFNNGSAGGNGFGGGTGTGTGGGFGVDPTTGGFSYNGMPMDPNTMAAMMSAFTNATAGGQGSNTLNFNPNIQTNDIQDSNTYRKPPLFRSPGEALSNMGRGIVNGARNIAVQIPKNTGRFYLGALKSGTRLIGGATGAMLGMAAGLASNNYTNVITYGAAGTYAGAGIGGAVGDSAANVIQASTNVAGNIREDVKRDVLTKDAFKEFENRQKNRQRDSDWEYRRELQQKFGKEWTEKMKEAHLYRNNGVDESAIISALEADTRALSEKFKQDARGNFERDRNRDYIPQTSTQLNITAAKYSSQVSTPKDLHEIRQSLLKQNYDPNRVQAMTNHIARINKWTK